MSSAIVSITKRELFCEAVGGWYCLSFSGLDGEAEVDGQALDAFGSGSSSSYLRMSD